MFTETEKQNLAYRFAIAKAGIVRGEQGRAIRTIVEQGHRKPVGKFVSLKCGVAMPWESFHELHLMWLSEADTSVERFLAQPFRMWFKVGGKSKMITYVPDFERRLAGGRWEVIEVKKTKDQAAREPDYAEKMARARMLGHTEGFRFRVMTAEKHIRGVALRNAEAIVRDRFTTVTTRDAEAFREAVESEGGGVAPYRRAIEKLSASGNRFDPLAKAKLHALVVRRIANFDIRRPVKDETPVRLISARRRAAA